MLTLGSNQVATGLALTIFGIGLSSLIGAGYVGMTVPSFDSVFPGLARRRPDRAGAVRLQPARLFRLLHGVRRRLVPQPHPRGTGAARGRRERHLGPFDRLSGDRRSATRAIAFGGALAGIARQSYFSMVITPLWAEQMTAGRGWIALALVVFSGWRAGPAARGRLFLRHSDDARALRQGLRLLVSAVAVLGRDALHDGDRRARRHIGARASAGARRRPASASRSCPTA